MTTVYWIGSTGTQGSPSSGEWDLNQPADWSSGQTPNGVYQGPPVDVVFNVGSYSVSIADDQYNKSLNAIYYYVYPYEVASITFQLGANVSLQTSSGQVAAGIECDGALTNNGNVTLDVLGSGVTAGSAVNSGTLTISGGAFTDYGSFSNSKSVNLTGGSFTASGTYANSGTTTISGGALDFGLGEQLTGGGTVTLTSGSITGGSNVNNTISGHGVVDLDSNSGTIKATGGTLTIGSLLLNAHYLEATDSTGILAINSEVLSLSGGGSILASGGGAVKLNAGSQIGYQTLTATGAGSTIMLGGLVQDSTIDATSGGLIEAAGGVLDGSTNAGALTIADMSSQANSLSLKDTITNSGAITLSGNNADAELLIAGVTNLQGGGAITLSGGGLDIIDALSVSDTFNNIDNTISGAGTLGQGGLVLSNEAMIDATGGQLIVNLAAGAPSVNSGTMEATSDADLDLVRGVLTNKGMIAAAAGGDLEIGRSFAITNATGATIEANGGAMTIAGVSSVNSGTIEALNGGDVDFARGQGAFTNSGEVDVEAGSSSEIESGFAFANSGTVDASGGAITIGGLGANAGSFDNDGGLVEAGGGGSVVIAKGATSSVKTGGVLAGGWSSGQGGTLAFGDAFTHDAGRIMLSGGGVITDAGRTLQASLTDISGELDVLGQNYTTTNALSLEGVLSNTNVFTSGLITGAVGSTIEGSGTIASSVNTSGSVDVENVLLTLTGKDSFSGALGGSGSLTFSNDTATLLNGASIGVNLGLSGATLSIEANLADAFNVHETSSTLSVAPVATLTLSGATTLTGGKITGGGDVALTGTATATGAFTLDAGTELDVSGGGALTMTAGTFADNGRVSVSGGTLSVSGGTFSDAGSLVVSGAGNAITFSGAGVLSNASLGTLKGGTYSSLNGAVMTLTGGALSVDAATITLGGGGVIKAGGGATFTSIQSTLSTIAAGASLNISGGTYQFTKALTLNGTLSLASPPGSTPASFSSGTIAASAGSMIVGGFGGATLASSLTDAGGVTVAAMGSLSFTGAQDTFSGAFASAGNLTGLYFTAGVDTFAAGASLSDANTYINGATVQLKTSVVDSGNFSLESGELSLRFSFYTFTVDGTSSFSGGTVLGPGTLALDGDSAVSGLKVAGSVVLSNAATMTVSGGLILDTSHISNLSTGAIVLQTGGAITLASGKAGTFGNAGLLEKAAGATDRSLIGATVTNTGKIAADGGALEFSSAIAGSGGVLDIGGGTLQLDALQGAGQSIDFLAGGGVLALKAFGAEAAAVAGFTAGDAFDLLGMSGGSVKSFTEASNHTQGSLVVSNGTQTDTLTLLGVYTAANFVAGSDAKGGTTISYHA